MTLLLLLIACTTASTSSAPTCALEGDWSAEEAVSPGDTVSIPIAPMTESFDTVVLVGSVRADGVSVSREGCDACDACKDADTGCTDCAACEACEDDCASCVESVSFVVPDVPAGSYEVRVTNTHGTSAAFRLEVAAGTPPDSGSAR